MAGCIHELIPGPDVMFIEHFDCLLANSHLILQMSFLTDVYNFIQ